MPKVSIRAYGRLIKMSDTAVRQMIEYGRITAKSIDYTKPHRPLIDVDLANKDLARNTDPNQTRKTRAGETSLSLLKAETRDSKYVERAKKVKRSAEKIAEQIDLDNEGNVKPNSSGTGPTVDLTKDPLDMYEAREHEAIWKAIIKKMEAQKMRRELASIEEINIDLGNLAVQFRSDVVDIADRICEDCYAAVSVFEVREIIYNACEAALLKNSKLLIE